MCWAFLFLKGDIKERTGKLEIWTLIYAHLKETDSLPEGGRV
jgi:hypothetical protein